jgi:hypothetical protein
MGVSATAEERSVLKYKYWLNGGPMPGMKYMFSRLQKAVRRIRWYSASLAATIGY